MEIDRQVWIISETRLFVAIPPPDIFFLELLKIFPVRGRQQLLGTRNFDLFEKKQHFVLMLFCSCVNLNTWETRFGPFVKPRIVPDEVSPGFQIGIQSEGL